MYSDVLQLQNDFISDILGTCLDGMINSQRYVLDAYVKKITQPMKFYNIVNRDIPKPHWWGEHSVIDMPGVEGVVLRHYVKDNTKQDRIPTLFGPPMAGHTSHIVHHKPGQSLIETAHDGGINDVYVLDWLSTPKERQHETIDDYIEKTKHAVEAIRERYTSNVPFNMFGFCQNGWQMTMYNCIFPEDVNYLISAGAPIDPQAGNSKIKQSVNQLPDYFFDSLVTLGDGRMDGRFMVAGFVTFNPIDRLNDLVKLYKNVHDDKFVERHKDFFNWYYHHVIKLPGAFYKQVVKELFKESRLVKGTMELSIFGTEHSLDLKDINNSKMITIGGRDDDITDAIDCHCLADHVGKEGTGFGKDDDGDYIVTSPKDVSGLVSQTDKKVVQLTAPAGHLGLFISGKVLRDYYVPIFAQIARENGP